jgi:hypothetical protein
MNMKMIFIIVATSGVAHANSRALPFTYTTDTLAPGQAEIEETVDLTPLRGHTADGNRTSYLSQTFQTELEIGVCDRLELALYFTFAPTYPNISDPATMPEATGIKQRARYIFADPGVWPIDVGVYGEFAESDHEVEFEAKLLLQKRFDKLRLAANLWAEYDVDFEADPVTGDHQRDVVVNPTLGATYEITPRLSIGIDSWLRGEYPTNPSPATRSFGLGPEYYIGPAVMMSFPKVWWTVAAYGRVTDLDHAMVAGEPYGKVWFRTMIGYNL